MRLWTVLLGAALALSGCLDGDDGGGATPQRDMFVGGGGQGGAGGAGGGAGGAGGEGGGAVEDACPRPFVYRHRGATAATEVRLAGEFERPAWSGAIVLEDADGDGFWTTQVDVAPGRYQYKFIVDGTWIADPDNGDRVPDGEGGQNTVAEQVCPFTPECLSDGDCAEPFPLCRNLTCVDANPCFCAEGEVCDASGACIAEPECTEDADCEAPLVCRDFACAPECLGDEDCGEGEQCLDLQCVAPECETWVECDAFAESCVSAQCVEKVCADHIFTYDPQGATHDQVYLAGSFTNWQDNWIPMTWLADRGVWFARTALANDSYQYKFVLVTGGNQQWVADPSNPDSADDGFGGRNSVLTVLCDDEPGPGPSMCGEVAEFDWRDAVMYFAMVDRFHDSDGQRDIVQGVTDGPADGPSGQYMGGDIRGLTAKIDYLTNLGVSAIWITAPFENRNSAGAAIDPGSDPHTYSGYHGYWPSPANVDYADPDNPSPTPQVESRIGTAADLQAFVDASHAAGVKVLFDYVMNHVDVESGLYQAHNDWFARRDGRFALCGPENLWDDPFWGTRCAFTDYLPPFDFDNAAARAWSVNDALWWATHFGIDGYRLDAIKHVSLQWLRDLRDALDARIPDPAGGRFYLVGETFAYDNRDLLRSFVDPAELLDGQFDFPFKARICEAVFTPGGNLGAFAGWMGGNDSFYGPGSLMTTWIGNHDIPRPIHFASRQIGNCRQGSDPGNGWNQQSHGQPQDAAPYERLGVVFAIMMTNPGIPLIYYGDEIGLAGGGDPDNRRMMVWDDADLNAHQIALREKVAKLGRIRTENKVLGRGRRLTLDSGNDHWVFRMTGCGDASPDITVAINKGDGPATVNIPAGAYTDLMNDAAVQGGQTQVPPRGFLILRRD
ncbi:MAG: hypothetical protein H6702_17255 [Myxococcales bacterium]|nr:hypothetical protein [Myxococcales bacterium]